MPCRASRSVCIRTSVEKHMEQCMRLLSATQCTYLERPSNPSFGKFLQCGDMLPMPGEEPP